MSENPSKPSLRTTTLSLEQKLLMGQRAKRARELAGLTQKELGEALGLSPRMVQEMEAGRQGLLAHAGKIEEVTGKPKGWLAMALEDPFEKVAEMQEQLDRIEDKLAALLRIGKGNPS